jgi:hypothetical protein
MHVFLTYMVSSKLTEDIYGLVKYHVAGWILTILHDLFQLMQYIMLRK